MAFNLSHLYHKNRIYVQKIYWFCMVELHMNLKANRNLIFSIYILSTIFVGSFFSHSDKKRRNVLENWFAVE